MTYMPSRDAVDSLMRLGEKIAAEARRDREIKRATRERETKLLDEFNGSRAKAEPRAVAKSLKGEASFRLAKAARDMLAEGKPKEQVCRTLGVRLHILDYHLEKHGMKSAEKDTRFISRVFTLSDEARAYCDAHRPHVSWEDISAHLNINRSTLIKHYMRKAEAKRGGRCNARGERIAA